MKNPFKTAQIYLIFLAMLSIISCKQNNKPDVSDIDVNIKIRRFDKDLSTRKNNDIAQTDLFLSQNYGVFYDDYIHKMVGRPEYSGTDILNILYRDQAYADLVKETDSVHANLKPLEENLTEAFKYIKYYYPQAKVPTFITYVSGFEAQIALSNHYMGIGLDMFLGGNSKFYGAIVQSAPKYLSRRYAPEYIVPRVVETYAREELFVKQQELEDRTLLTKMINNGKILYFMDKILPDDSHDTLKIGYTLKQLEWCKTYEKDIWAYFLDNNYLYETDLNKTQVFIGEGPF
ncbi:MAG: gliding motility lipoprotein GldB, partial [Sphingobacteriaceae bacterium]|nr:gliding motility lipoprotein GldB [Sphingobacteriaceae bacterium]